MPANLQSLKVVRGTGNASPPFNTLVQAIEDSLNAIGDSTLNGWGSGLVFDPAQIKQNAAVAGQQLAWDGAKYAPATPASTTIAVLADTTLSAAAASFDFTSIAGTYKHLWVVGYARTDRADPDDDLGIRFNNDSGSNYDGYVYRVLASPPSANGPEALAQSSAKLTNTLQGDNAVSGAFGAFEFFVPHYAGAANQKVIQAQASRRRSASAWEIIIYRGTGAWRSNSAITRLTILPLSGTNFKAGSRVALYGF